MTSVTPSPTGTARAATAAARGRRSPVAAGTPGDLPGDALWRWRGGEEEVGRSWWQPDLRFALPLVGARTGRIL
jgi:hypothetical protein